MNGNRSLKHFTNTGLERQCPIKMSRAIYSTINAAI